ncbi:hypothetical protein [Streptomyces virginiae]|uniref:hypothetical protein n=1 Tax=Streptomyces virginiae TaxID=1961 RepID=UPI0032458DA1
MSGPRVEGAVSSSGHGKAIPVPALSVLRFPMNQPGKPEPADENQVTASPLLLTFLVALPSPCPLPHRSVITKMLPGTVGGLDAWRCPRTALCCRRPHWGGHSCRSDVLAAPGTPAGPMSLAALTQVCAEITGKPLPEEDFADGTVDAYRTVVEMVTIQGPDRLAPQEEVLRETLARCFDVLTDVSSMDSMVPPHTATRSPLRNRWRRPSGSPEPSQEATPTARWA